MRLSDASRIANHELERFGLKERGWTFRFDNAPKRFGCCRWGTKEITLSRHLTEINDHDEVYNTILHEVAHALAGKHAGHGPEWVRTAKQIGCDGQRFYSTAKVTVLPHRAKIRIADIRKDAR